MFKPNLFSKEVFWSIKFANSLKASKDYQNKIINNHNSKSYKCEHCFENNEDEEKDEDKKEEN